MTKTVNYTADQTRDLVSAYTEAGSDEMRDTVVAHYAEVFAKSTKSIVAKLSREGVYIPKAKQGKKGGVKKNDVASAIGAVLQLTDAEADSLTKANLTALNKVWNFLRTASGEVGEID